ncbi:MAG: ABC transporter permease [Rhodanobacter sp.]
MFGYDLQLALHGLKRFPRSTVLAVITVALGLSASMTTLALLHTLSADPLPGRSQHLYLTWVDTLLAKSVTQDSLNDIKSVDYHRIKLGDAQALLAAHRAPQQTALADMNADVSNAAGTHLQTNETVLGTTSTFIPMFGVPLREGRSWSAAEDATRSPVAVITAPLAQRLFGAADAIGNTMLIHGKPFRVIGVSANYAPQPHFYDLSAGTFGDDTSESIFAPYSALLDAGVPPYTADGCDKASAEKSLFNVDSQHCAWLSLWVQLDTPQQVAAYRQFLHGYVEQQQDALAAFHKSPHSALTRVAAWLTQQNVVPENVRLNVWLAGSFLLLCMLNVAGLLTARFLRRSSEIGIRRALGAPRRSVFVQHVLEAAAVCLFGGVLALPLTELGLWLLRLQDEGFTDLARLDPLMFGALFALALVVGVLVGLLPAWRAARVEPGLQVKSA